jgi:hypothetical protein
VCITVASPAQTVTYCHCVDCRRVTGAPVTAFAAVAQGDTVLSAEDPSTIRHVSHTEGVERWFCGACGSPLKAWFGYLPDQDYLPLGLLDQAPELTPEHHCFIGSAMPWMKIDDALPRSRDSGADILGRASDG